MDPSWDPNHARIQRHFFVNIMVSAPPRTSASQLQGRGGCQALDVANPAGPWRSVEKIDEDLIFNWIYLPWKSWNNQKDHERSWKIMKDHEKSWKIMKDHERSSAPINCTLPLSPVTKASSWSIHQTINSSYNCTSDVKPLPVRIQMSANVVHRSLRHTSYRAMPCWKSCKIEILIVSDRILSYLSFWMFFVSTLRHDSPRYRDSASIASTQNP